VILDGLGGLFLTYDLVGGKHGPLRAITKSVTSGVMFGIVYRLPLGTWFGLAGLVVSGPALSLEIGRSEVRNVQPFLKRWGSAWCVRPASEAQDGSPRMPGLESISEF
jgi:hypothetical protein